MWVMISNAFHAKGQMIKPPKRNLFSPIRDEGFFLGSEAFLFPNAVLSLQLAAERPGDPGALPMWPRVYEKNRARSRDTRV